MTPRSSKWSSETARRSQSGEGHARSHLRCAGRCRDAIDGAASLAAKTGASCMAITSVTGRGAARRSSTTSFCSARDTTGSSTKPATPFASVARASSNSATHGACPSRTFPVHRPAVGAGSWNETATWTSILGRARPETEIRWISGTQWMRCSHWRAHVGLPKWPPSGQQGLPQTGNPRFRGQKT